MSPWTLRVPAALGGQPATPTASPAMDIDPRSRTVILGLQPRSGGDAALWSGALLRHHFSPTASPVDWRSACDWLRGEEAAALLDCVSAGYTAEILWSGDWSARWQPEALRAAHALLDHVQLLLTRQAS